MFTTALHWSLTRQRWASRLLLACALLLTALIYRPALHGPFVFDDQINVVNNQHLKLQTLSFDTLREAALSMPSGLFSRPISMLSFALNYYVERDTISPFPLAYPFKVTNLAIHLINGVAIYFLTALLVGAMHRRASPHTSTSYAQWLALAVSSAWLLHPLNTTGVLYVVQRMASLESLFVYAGLITYLLGRQRLEQGRSGWRLLILCSLLLFTPLAVFAKENGLLLPLFILLVEVFVFRFQAPADQRRQLRGLFFILVVLPVVAAAFYVIRHYDVILAGYARRNFSLTERLLTESRVVWFYLRGIVFPSTALMGLYHDDFSISRGWLQPASTLLSVVGLLGLAALVWLLRVRQPLIAFGIAFFLLGHSVESTVIPLELVHEHRNYLPMFGILLAFFHLLLNPAYAPGTVWLRRMLVLLLVLLFAAGTLSRAQDWSSAAALWQTEVRNHPESARAQIANGDFYANAIAVDAMTEDSYFHSAQESYGEVLAFDKYNTDALFSLIQLSSTHGRPVDPAWTQDLLHGLEHGTLPLNTNERLVSLANCVADAQCPLQKKDFEAFVQAALRNPKVQGRDKGLIYSAQILYLYQVQHDYGGALAAAQAASALDADMEYRLWQATIYVAMHKTQEARAQIAIIKEMDRNKLKAADLALLEQELERRP